MRDRNHHQTFKCFLRNVFDNHSEYTFLFRLPDALFVHVSDALAYPVDVIHALGDSYLEHRYPVSTFLRPINLGDHSGPSTRIRPALPDRPIARRDAPHAPRFGFWSVRLNIANWNTGSECYAPRSAC